MTDTFQKQIEWWRESSKSDFRVAKLLFEQKHYSESLFFCHLSLEKLLKTIVMKQTKQLAPYVHDLRYLAEVANVTLDEEKEKLLEVISTFHLAARYPDVKLKFYKKYNKKEVVQPWLQRTESLLQWLEEEYQKK